MSLERSVFGHLPDGREIDAWRLGAAGVTATILGYGARIAALEVPLGGRRVNVVLGHAGLADYLADRACLGAVCGRYANRIAGGRFVLDGRAFELPRNNGANTLHGGLVGFHQVLWQAAPDGEALLLRHVSPDGDQGFPGTLRVTVRYAVTGNALAIDYTATTDAPTVLNLTNHAYFNLAGSGDILGHVVSIPAERFTPVDAALIPTGELRPVAGTPFDFRTPMAIGARIDADDAQLRVDPGYDHNFVLGEAPSATPRLAARVQEAGLVMEVLTTEPGVQLYTGNFLPPAPFGHRGGLCLETQHFPDSPNRPQFPSTVLRPGETFRSRTEFHFSASS
jgi:aldose 1-epimerase